MFKSTKRIKKKLRSFLNNIIRYTELNKKLVIASLQEKERQKGPKCLVHYGYKVYSKNEEDGMIAEIFNRIGTTNKVFVEIGAGDGLENNTLTLLFEGWKGLWIESSSKSCNKMRNGYRKTIESGRLKIVNAFITKDNIDSLIDCDIEEAEIDLLSIDVDGNDYHILNAVKCIKPRALVIETNVKFHPPIMYCMQYNEKHIWDGSDNYGVSLKFLEVKLKEKGYLLVGCNLTGSNAFFVRQDLVEDKFYEPFTAENHYQPGRFEIATHQSGHRPSYDTLDNSLSE
ncbi:MAG: hypothetical protein JW804_05615 [Sedimentisphaerales bacterium]|nr:hypothetical protein [Sedimentisphaerales bacterium]